MNRGDGIKSMFNRTALYPMDPISGQLVLIASVRNGAGTFCALGPAVPARAVTLYSHAVVDLADLVFNCRVSANGKRKKDKINEMKRFASARRCTEVNIREKGRKNRRASSSSSSSTQVIGEGSSVAEGNSSSWLKSLRAYNSTDYHRTAPSVDA